MHMDSPIKFRKIDDISRSKENNHHYAEYIFYKISLKANCDILIEISLKFDSTVRTNNMPTMVQLMTRPQ